MEKEQTKKLNIGSILSEEDFSEDKELVKSLSKIEFKDFLKTFINHLAHDHKLTSEQIEELFGKKTEKD